VPACVLTSPGSKEGVAAPREWVKQGRLCAPPGLWLCRGSKTYTAALRARVDVDRWPALQAAWPTRSIAEVSCRHPLKELKTQVIGVVVLLQWIRLLFWHNLSHKVYQRGV